MKVDILAIDPANRTGFAHSDGYRGVVDLQKRFDTHPGDRLKRFREWLNEMIDRHVTEMLAAEDSTFGSHNPSVQAQHNELRGVLKLVAAERGLEVKLFNPGTIKVFATGSGRAKKPQMIAACKRLLGIEAIDDNEADAVWILELAKRPDCWPEKKPTKAQQRKRQSAQPRLWK